MARTDFYSFLVSFSSRFLLRMAPRDPGKSSWLEERVIRDLGPRMGIIRGRTGSNRAREGAGEAVRSGPKKWLRSRCDCRGNGFMEKDERLFIRFTGREMPRPLWGPPNGTHSVGSWYMGRPVVQKMLICGLFLRYSVLFDMIYK